jgi:hypothetical protein
MDEDRTINWAEQYLVEVKKTLEELPHTDPWVERCLSKKIEGEFGLWKEKIPKVQGIGKRW